MMNMKMLLGAATALSMVGSTAALAGPSDKVVYGINVGPVTANVPVPQHNQFPGNAIVGAADFANGVLGFLGGPDAMAARYEQESTVAGNTDGNQTSVTAKFTLNGSVSKDCSFYAGDAVVSGGVFNQTINLGTIGIQTGNNVNSSLAFDQVGPINAHVNTSTAGCNTNNTVTVAKLNGSAGLLNVSPGSYDSNQFTDRIPYTIQANWTGIGSGVGAGTPQSITVAATDDWENLSQGAWRSSFDLTITAPPPALGLVAGNYSDAVIVSLAAW